MLFWIRYFYFGENGYSPNDLLSALNCNSKFSFGFLFLILPLHCPVFEPGIIIYAFICCAELCTPVAASM